MLKFVASTESIPALLVDPKSRVTSPAGVCIGLTVLDVSGVPSLGMRLETLLYDEEIVHSLYLVLEYAQFHLDSSLSRYSLDIDDISYSYCQDNGIYISGTSLTLSYLFGLILYSKDIPWPKSTFVTGSVIKNKHGWYCESVGLFKSKLKLAAEFGYNNFFVPQANLRNLKLSLINPSLYDTSRLIPMPKKLMSCLDIWAAYTNNTK